MSRIIIFGDSITWGAFDKSGQGWVNRLRKYYDNNGIDNSVYNCGISGNSTRELLARFDIEAKFRSDNRNKKEICIISIGTNDAWFDHKKNDYNVSIKDFENNIKLLIDKSNKIFTQTIFLGLLPVDESKTTPVPWYPISYFQKDVTKYNNIIEKVCKDNSVKFISMDGLINPKDMNDGLHPDDEGHQIITNHIIKHLK